jgi:hypothetical protein
MTPPQELGRERFEKTWSEADQDSPNVQVMEKRKAAIKLEDGTLIVGKINILSEPPNDYEGLYLKHLNDRGTYFKRISDIFTKGKNPFVVIFDVAGGDQEGTVLIINKQKILWVAPQD